MVLKEARPPTAPTEPAAQLGRWIHRNFSQDSPRLRWPLVTSPPQYKVWGAAERIRIARGGAGGVSRGRVKLRAGGNRAAGHSGLGVLKFPGTGACSTCEQDSQASQSPSPPPSPSWEGGCGPTLPPSSSALRRPNYGGLPIFHLLPVPRLSSKESPESLDIVEFQRSSPYTPARQPITGRASFTSKQLQFFQISDFFIF